MANVVFIFEHEEGHLLPTFKLAASLAARGHTVHYAGLADAADLIRDRGFAFTPVFEEISPPGTVTTLRSMSNAVGPHGQVPPEEAAKVAPLPLEEYAKGFVNGKDLEEIFHTVRPDLFVASSFQPLHALILHYRFRRPVVLLTPWLRPHPKTWYCEIVERTLLELGTGLADLFDLVQRADPRVRSLSDVSRRLLEMRELILCPAELEIPKAGTAAEPEVHHVEASVDLGRRGERGFPWERLDPGCRLLYASVGSQSHTAGREKVRRLLGAVVEAFGGRPGWQVALSTGGLARPEDFHPLPPNVIALPWMPQIPLLERADVMITHGGLGTVKECIFHGVPMVAFPMAHDQPDNARRIVHNNLGLAGDFHTASAEEIAAKVQFVAGDETVRRQIDWMQGRFREIEESGIGVRRIEEVLNRQAAAAPRPPSRAPRARAFG